MGDLKQEAVKHTRSIHFALLVISGALFLSMSFLNQGIIRNAIQDVYGILQLQNLIKEDPAFLHGLAKKRFDESQKLSVAMAAEDEPVYEVLFEINGQPEKVLLKAKYPEFTLRDRKPYYPEIEDDYYYWNIDRDERIEITAPKTLGDFRKFWNFYNQERYIYYFPRNRTLTDNGNFYIKVYQFSAIEPDGIKTKKLHSFYDDPVKKRLSFISFPKSVLEVPSIVNLPVNIDNSLPLVELLLRELEHEDIYAKDLTHEYHVIDRVLFGIIRRNEHWETVKKLSDEEINKWKLALKKKAPLHHPSEEQWIKTSFQGHLSDDVLFEVVHRMIPISINYQHYFADVVEAKWPAGNYEFTFRDLHTVFNNNMDEVSLEKLINILNGELKRSGDKLEFFGIKIPSEALRTWGLLALLGLQAYFLLHYMTLVRTINNGDSALQYPWIGMFKDIVSRILFLFTASVLPLIVVTYSLFVFDSAIGYLFFCISGIISIFSAKEILEFQASLIQDTSKTKD